MNSLTVSARGCARVVLLATALVATVLVASAIAQEPLTARIFFKNLPPGPVPTFDLSGTSKITVVIQVKNPGSTDVLAAKGAFGADFWRRLFVTDPLGGLGTFTGPLAHPDTQLYYCHSRQGVLQRPTAIPVAPLEVIPANTTVEWEVTDLRKLYAVPQIGRYVVQLRSPVITVVPSSLGRRRHRLRPGRRARPSSISVSTPRRPVTISRSNRTRSSSSSGAPTTSSASSPGRQRLGVSQPDRHALPDRPEALDRRPEVPALKRHHADHQRDRHGLRHADLRRPTAPAARQPGTGPPRGQHSTSTMPARSSMSSR